MKKVVIVSGYFNPIHIGHIRLLEAGKALGDELVVIVNNDRQQVLKKGKIIMNEAERLKIVDSIKFVDKAVLSIDDDPTIIKSLEMVAAQHPGCKLVFGNGGDRKSPELVPEYDVCQRHNIEMLFDVGGTDKPNSSSNINKLLGIE